MRKAAAQVLREAVEKGDGLGVQLALRGGADVNSPDPSTGLQPLHSAAWHGRTGLLGPLLSHGALVNARSSAGLTPLLLAAWAGHRATAMALVAAGCAMGAKDVDGGTALHACVRNGHLNLAAQLLEARADPDAQDGAGETGLGLAAAGGSKDLVGLLLSSRADPAICNQRGQTPLHQAAWHGHEGAVEVLLDSGTELAAADCVGATPADYCLQRGHKSLLELLSRVGSYPTGPQADDPPPRPPVADQPVISEQRDQLRQAGEQVAMLRRARRAVGAAVRRAGGAVAEDELDQMGECDTMQQLAVEVAGETKAMEGLRAGLEQVCEQLQAMEQAQQAGRQAVKLQRSAAAQAASEHLAELEQAEKKHSAREAGLELELATIRQSSEAELAALKAQLEESLQGRRAAEERLVTEQELQQAGSREVPGLLDRLERASHKQALTLSMSLGAMVDLEEQLEQARSEQPDRIGAVQRLLEQARLSQSQIAQALEGGREAGSAKEREEAHAAMAWSLDGRAAQRVDLLEKELEDGRSSRAELEQSLAASERQATVRVAELEARGREDRARIQALEKELAESHSRLGETALASDGQPGLELERALSRERQLEDQLKLSNERASARLSELSAAFQEASARERELVGILLDRLDSSPQPKEEGRPDVGLQDGQAGWRLFGALPGGCRTLAALAAEGERVSPAVEQAGSTCSSQHKLTAMKLEQLEKRSQAQTVLECCVAVLRWRLRSLEAIANYKDSRFEQSLISELVERDVQLGQLQARIELQKTQTSAGDGSIRAASVHPLSLSLSSLSTALRSRFLANAQ